MKFQNDIPEHRIKLPRPGLFHKGLLANVEDVSEADLKSFLSRPVIVKQGTWASTSIANTEIDSVKIPLDVISASKTMGQKIAGFLGFRAKTIIRLQVNTNRFQQGRLMMTFFPNESYCTVKHAHVQASLMNRTQLPRIDFDAASDTEVLMEVPYICNELAYNTTLGIGKVGHVGLVVYSPLTSASSELSAQYTIWAHFEDVELMYPTISSTTAVPQSGGRRKLRANTREVEEVEAEQHTGYISGALSKISKASTILSEIPLLSSIAEPAAWATNIFANAASALGFSNPMNNDQVSFMVQRNFSKATNCSGIDSSYNLGLSEDNHIEHLPNFAGQDIDEMALAYPLSIYTFFDRFSWTTSQLNGTSLYTIPLDPSRFTSGFGAVGGMQFATPIAYVANMFQIYRGSLKFKFKVVKTDFHSGRLVVSYIPGLNNSTTVNAGNNPFLHRIVFDLRTTSEIEFVAPYAATRPYTQVGETYGTIDISVLNELRAPDTVTQNVDVIMEIAGADDLEFNNFVGLKQVPCFATSTATAQSGGNREMRAPLAAEQHLSQSMVQMESGPAIGSSGIVGDEMASARFCVGEKISSFRQIIKRAAMFLRVREGATATSNTIYPYTLTLPCYYNNGTSSVWTNAFNGLSGVADCNPDLFSAVTACYSYWRGSVRLKVTGNAAPLSDFRIAFRPGVYSSSLTTTSSFSTSTSPRYNFLASGFCPIMSSVQPCAEVQVPYYSATHMSCVGIDGARGQNNVSLFQNVVAYTAVSSNTRPLTTVFTSTGGHGDYNVYRQAGDDYSCGFWTGCPALIASSSVAPAYTTTSEVV